MVQLVLVACFGLIAIAPIVLVVSLVRFLSYRTDLRKLVIAASFQAGFLVAGWGIWRAAMPDGWALPFWTTMQAAIDSDTYGHATEHAAEILAAKTIILSVCGGLVAASLAWVVTRPSKSPRLGGFSKA